MPDNNIPPAEELLDSNPPETLIINVSEMFKKIKEVPHYPEISIEHQFDGKNSLDFYKGMIAGTRTFVSILKSAAKENPFIKNLLQPIEEQSLMVNFNAAYFANLKNQQRRIVVPETDFHSFALLHALKRLSDLKKEKHLPNYTASTNLDMIFETIDQFLDQSDFSKSK